MPEYPSAMDYMATIKIAPFLRRKGPRWVLHTWDANKYDHTGKVGIAYRLIQIEPDGTRTDVFTSQRDGLLWHPMCSGASDSPRNIADQQAAILSFYCAGMDEEGDYHEPEHADYLALAGCQIREVAGDSAPEIDGYDRRSALAWIDDGDGTGAWYMLAPFDGGYMEWGLTIRRYEWRDGYADWWIVYSNPNALSNEAYGADEDEDDPDCCLEWDDQTWSDRLHDEAIALVECFVGEG